MTNPVPPPPPGAPQRESQKTSDIIGQLRPAKLFKSASPETAVTSLCFDDSGEWLLAASSDESLQIYNAREGAASKTLLSKKYGCHLARFTHHAGSIIYASTKGDDTLRYLSTHDNQFLRYFKGHTAPVTSLALNPANDTFVSCSLDDTVRLWNLSSPHSQGKLNLLGATLATYDASANVLAIGSSPTSSILMYDLRNFESPPFATFDIQQLDNHSHVALHGAQHPRDWTKLEFSNNGRHLLVGTNADAGHLLLDAYTGRLKAFLARAPQHLPLSSSRQRPAPWPAPPTGVKVTPGQGDVSFTSDGRYVIGASGGDKDAVVWDLSSLLGAKGAERIDGEDGEEGTVLRPIASLPCKGRIGVIEWNPRYNMLASGDHEVVMWLPDEHVGTKPA
jgi:COMPASS component SWD2